MRGQKSGLCQATGAQIIRKHHKQIGRCPRPIWSWAKWREATGARMGQQESQDQSWLPWEDIDGIGCGRQRWGPLFPVCMTKGTAGLLNYKQKHGRTSLVVQWLRLHAPNAGGSGSIPSQGTRSHVLQQSVHMLQLKIPHAETQNSQINKLKYKFF